MKRSFRKIVFAYEETSLQLESIKSIIRKDLFFFAIGKKMSLKFGTDQALIRYLLDRFLDFRRSDMYK